MLAHRDQENLVHGQQAVAASKPLNHAQGSRSLAPKTPGRTVPKTPYKVPLNDENGRGGLGGGKMMLKSNGSKNAFVTPMGPSTRAPLGMKTTNAKAKGLQTPAIFRGDEGGKAKQASVSARKPKPKINHAEMTKVETAAVIDDVEVPDIEYMPPPVKDLPDLPPEDCPPLDLSGLEGGFTSAIAFELFATNRGPDGLTHFEREEQARNKEYAIMDQRNDAAILRDMESVPVPCLHTPECPGVLCKTTIMNRKRAQEEYEKTIAMINAETAPKRQTKAPGPSTVKAKAAVSLLARPDMAKPISDPVKKTTNSTAKSRLNLSLLAQPKRRPEPTQPSAINASSMRHTAAKAASRTTLGRAQGRTVSASIPKAVPAKKEKAFTPFEDRDTSLAPAEYYRRWGSPPGGSRMWMECWQRGILKDSPNHPDSSTAETDDFLDDLLRKDALEDFQLVLE